MTSKVVTLAAYPAYLGADTDWLRELPVGAEFLARASYTTYEVEEYEVISKTDTCVLLVNSTNIERYFWVISKEFSRENYKIEVLSYG